MYYVEIVADETVVRCVGVNELVSVLLLCGVTYPDIYTNGHPAGLHVLSCAEYLQTIT